MGRNKQLDIQSRVSHFPPKRSKIQRLQFNFARRLFNDRGAALFLRAQATEPDNPVRVVCISDTHGYTAADVPTGDLLIHAGDLTNTGTLAELRAQLDWLNSLPHLYKVFIAGNHDLCLDTNFPASRGQSDERSLYSHDKFDVSDWRNLIYLQEDTVSLEFPNGRRLSVYGSPYSPKFGDWAFQYPLGSDYWASKIPADTDIVIVHGPPRCHMDINSYGASVGCPSFRNELARVKPKLAVFGHIHEAYGQEVVVWDRLQAAWEQVLLNEATYADMLTLVGQQLYHGFGGPVLHETRLVNASLCKEKGQEEHQNPILTLV